MLWQGPGKRCDPTLPPLLYYRGHHKAVRLDYRFGSDSVSQCEMLNGHDRINHFLLLRTSKSEFQKLRLAFLYSLFIMASFFTLKPARYAQFLSNIGVEQLPYMYRGLGLFLACAVALTDTCALRIRSLDFMDLLSDNDRICRLMIRTLALKVVEKHL